MRTLAIASLILVIIGALNWGLVGLFGLDLVRVIFGQSFFARLVYVVVGLAGIYGIFMAARLTSARDDVCVPGHLTQAAPPAA